MRQRRTPPSCQPNEKQSTKILLRRHAKRRFDKVSTISISISISIFQFQIFNFHFSISIFQFQFQFFNFNFNFSISILQFQFFNFNFSISIFQFQFFNFNFNFSISRPNDALRRFFKISISIFKLNFKANRRFEKVSTISISRPNGALKRILRFQVKFTHGCAKNADLATEPFFFRLERQFVKRQLTIFCSRARSTKERTRPPPLKNWNVCKERTIFKIFTHTILQAIMRYVVYKLSFTCAILQVQIYKLK
jgi:hypothetical protein